MIELIVLHAVDRRRLTKIWIQAGSLHVAIWVLMCWSRFSLQRCLALLMCRPLSTAHLRLPARSLRSRCRCGRTRLCHRKFFERPEEEFVHSGAEFDEPCGVGAAGRPEDAIKSVGRCG